MLTRQRLRPVTQSRPREREIIHPFDLSLELSSSHCFFFSSPLFVVVYSLVEWFKDDKVADALTKAHPKLLINADETQVCLRKNTSRRVLWMNKIVIGYTDTGMIKSITAYGVNEEQANTLRDVVKEKLC